MTDADSRALDQLTALRSEIELLKVRAAAERVDRLVADIEVLRRDGSTEPGALERLRQALDGAVTE